MNDLMKEKLDSAEKHMKKIIERLQSEFSTIRAGRANAAVLDRIPVEYYGEPTPIKQLAQVSVPEARVLQIQPWDVSTIKAITKAILASDLGITPTDDGKVIRLVFPQLTEERRKELVKTISGYGNEAKVAVRNERRDVMEKFKKMQKNSEITEDDLGDADKKVQKLTDKYTAEIDKIVEDKKQELLNL